MDVEENNHACKRSRIGSKIGQKEQHQENDDDDGEGKRGGGGGGETRSMPWGVHPSSRIYRVSRASGGKDRHSKVYTAKGLRDRRVRLSVSTAIQFYDLQDRLGYDQPSKAIEWLIKASSAAINELPSLDGSFPESMKQEKPMLEAEVEDEAEGEAAYSQQQNQHLTKSGCSSTSETSKGSVLSLSRSENRVKARERARERTAKDKDKDREDGGGGSGSHAASHHYNVNTSLNSQTSFTELLTAGGSSSGAAAITNAQENSSNCRQLPAVTATADYFGQAGLFSTQTLHFGNNSPVGMVPFNIAAAAAAAAASGEHPEMQHFSFLQDHFPSPAVAAGDYNINFSNSPGLAGFNRGTLQSNSPSHQLPQHHHHHHHHHLQRLSPQVEGSNVPFFFGAAVPPAASAVTSADTQFTAGFDGRLQLWDRYRHSDLKGKGKS